MSEYFGVCKGCGAKLSFKDPEAWVLKAFGLKKNKKFKVPDYCRKCYNPDLGIDKRCSR